MYWKKISLKEELCVLYLAYRDLRTPWYIKLSILIIIGYALSPIDLIPDFIPILGHLDDLILLPLGIAITIKFIPSSHLEEYRKQAKSIQLPKKNWIAASVIIMLWAMGLLLLIKIMRS